MPDKHYLKVLFPATADNSPAIYDFFWKHLGPSLKAAGAREASLEIERLEPVDMIYSNLEMPREKAEKVLHGFAKSHHLKEAAELTFERHRTSLKGRVAVSKIDALLSDYNELFDIFFADLVVKTPVLTIDMMDGFSNSLLAIGERSAIQKFQLYLRRHMRGAKFEFVDHTSAGANLNAKKK